MKVTKLLGCGIHLEDSINFLNSNDLNEIFGEIDLDSCNNDTLKIFTAQTIKTKEITTENEKRTVLVFNIFGHCNGDKIEKIVLIIEE